MTVGFIVSCAFKFRTATAEEVQREAVCSGRLVGWSVGRLVAAPLI